MKYYFLEAFVSLEQISCMIDCCVNHNLEKKLPLLVHHNFLFFKKFNLGPLNHILLWKKGSNYGLSSSIRKRYLSDVNNLMGGKFIRNIEKFQQTEACIEALSIPDFYEMKWKASDSDNIIINESNEEPIEKEQINFCDKFGIIKYGLWKKTRQKCIEKGLEILPEKTTISRDSSKHEKPILSGLAALKDVFPDIMRESTIARYENKLKNKGERIEEQKKNKLEEIKKSQKDLTETEGKIREKNKKIMALETQKKEIEESVNKITVIFAPSGCEKKRKSYFNSWYSISNRRVEFAAEELSKLASFFPPELGWKTDPSDFIVTDENRFNSVKIADPNIHFKDITYSSKPAAKTQKEINMRNEIKEIDKMISDLVTDLNWLTSTANIYKIRISNINVDEYTEVYTSGGEEEIERLKAGRPVLDNLNTRHIKVIKTVAEKPKVKVLHNNYTNLRHVQKPLKYVEEFKTPNVRNINKKGKHKASSSESVLSANIYECLEYDDNDFISDLTTAGRVTENISDLFKNNQLYSSIKKRKEVLVETAKKLNMSQMNLKAKIEHEVRPHIYKQYKIRDSLNTLKKAFFCARNGIYPSVNKKWTDGVSIELKRCQWHYLISSCRICLGLHVDFEKERRKKEDEEIYNDWFESTFI